MSRAFAPGKMVLTGAYAVLRGAPAIVVGVSRGAIADDATTAPASPEVVAALGTDLGPEVDLRALFDGGRKLGLGASAAGLVATLAVLASRRGDRLDDPEVRAAVFRAGLAAHRTAQAGGSGVDVAASVFGGVLEYALTDAGPRVTPIRLPPGVTFCAYSAGVSARTTELRRRVDALGARDPALEARVFGELTRSSVAARDACRAADAGGFLASARAFGLALHALGCAAEAPLVSSADLELGASAAAMGGAFYPSGAGGGDVAVYLGPGELDRAAFDAEARRLGYSLLDLTIDAGGMRASSEPSSRARS